MSPGRPRQRPTTYRIGRTWPTLLAVALLYVLACAALPAVAQAQAVFPPGSAVGLTPPTGYDLQDGTAGFRARDGSGVLSIAEAKPPLARPPRAELIAQLGTISDRRLAAFGVRDVRRRGVETPAILGSIASGTLGAGADLETIWSLYFVGADAMGSISWRVAGQVTPEQAAAMERVLLSAVTRPPATLAERLDGLPFTFDTSLHDLTRINAGSALLASRDRDEQMLITILPPPDGPIRDRAATARSVLAHPLVLALVRDAAWQGPGVPEAASLAGQDGLLLRARVTHTPTGREMRLVLRVGFLAGGGLLVVLGCAPAPTEAAFALDEQRFGRVAGSVVLR